MSNDALGLEVKCYSEVSTNNTGADPSSSSIISRAESRYLSSKAYHISQMASTRRHTLFSLFGSALLAEAGQEQQNQHEPNIPIPPNPNEDRKLPNGKSQKDAIAKEQHEQALKDANDLVAVAEKLRDELRQAGQYVVPVASVKKTEEIEKLARRIRGRLKE